MDEPLFFWNRIQGEAEVDYLIAHRGNIYSVEVKEGKAGKLKSLHIFMKEKKTPFGIKISTDALSYENSILSAPFYLTAELQRLIGLKLS